MVVLLICMINITSCKSQSETIIKNGVILPLDSTIFNTKFLGKFELDTYNDKVEVWEVKSDTNTYIIVVKSDGVTMIKM